MRRLLRLGIIFAGCLLIAEASPGCADELNPQPLPPGKEEDNRGGTGQETPSTGNDSAAYEDGGSDAGDAGDAGDADDAGDGG